VTPRPAVDELDVATYRFPTATPEADGTFHWDATTAVVVRLTAAGRTGLGWTYSSPAAATVAAEHLRGAIVGRDAVDTAGGWTAMHRAGRNFGTRGLYLQAMSAVDIAWWDLKARLLDVSLAGLLGGVAPVPIYGSGGFTTLSDTELAEQVEQWCAAGCTAMKIKIGESWGSQVPRDLARVARLRELAGGDADLMVDANGGYSVGQACRVGTALDELGVIWFEEPVSSDDTAGLAAVRAAVRCDVTAGEYAADLYEARALVPVVDCLQLDVTRCGGYTGWLRCAALAQAAGLQVSGHCAPALHAPLGAVPNLRHVEYFIDHARLEPLLVDGVAPARDGALHPDPGRSGHGMRLRADADRWRVR
jgi:L-alanine-DL-glutamate epimerase-like enolase superfamily enzyme